MRSWLRNRLDGLDGRDAALRAAGRSGDEGISTIEVVILAPVMILFILVLVAFGQLVDGRGAVDGAARDAARAGSLQRDGGTAMSQARAAAEADLAGTCIGHPTVTKTSRGFAAGTPFAVEVSCKIRGFGILGLDITNTITSTSASPLDPYRRAAP
ncbi:TadE/TadG family type IV pilus assembly protein [Streptomyces sp. H39-S7]|uniref:TadE/TadG family type IV pilus assembly protein n=1 Tax=Streptomyces sp. H39-S7 TaxID=3004357 RepID=UPI0022AE977B|nr:TadE/TadG family type IV pilus assembly protein [Streptomyces sp. H39-S7]MCZ4118599.1 pilus assembly protein [Streptomyces sp. H39-S7]